MCRTKSPERIQADLDKAIRKERRERKRMERETQRALRLKRRMTHESVMKNGVPKVKPEESRFGLREAIAVNPWVWCDAGQHTVRESDMAGDICESCYYEYGERRPDRTLSQKEKQGDNPKGGFPYSPPMGKQGNLY